MRGFQFMTSYTKFTWVGADTAGQPLKDVIVTHLKETGWKVTDVGVLRDDKNPEMFQRVGFKVGSMISEGTPNSHMAATL